MKSVCAEVMERCPNDMQFFADRIDDDGHGRAHRKDARPLPSNGMTYTEAIDILQASGQDFEFPVELGQRPAVRARALPYRAARGQGPDAW